MKLRSVLLVATILAIAPAYAQTPPAPVAPVSGNSAVGNGGGRIHEAWERFEQEQSERKQRFEQEQAQRAQRFEEEQGRRKAEFEARMKNLEERRDERREEHPSFNNGTRPGAPVTQPTAPVAPVAPTTGTAQ